MLATLENRLVVIAREIKRSRDTNIQTSKLKRLITHKKKKHTYVVVPSVVTGFAIVPVAGLLAR